MAEIRSIVRRELRRIEFEGHIDECEILCRPREIVEAVRDKIVVDIASHVLKKVMPAIDRAIYDAFTKDVL